MLNTARDTGARRNLKRLKKKKYMLTEWAHLPRHLSAILGVTIDTHQDSVSFCVGRSNTHFLCSSTEAELKCDTLVSVLIVDLIHSFVFFLQFAALNSRVTELCFLFLILLWIVLEVGAGFFQLRQGLHGPLVLC